MVSPRGNAAGANAASFTTSYSFDPLGHLLSTIDPLGNHMTRVFDGDGNLASETDAANKTTSYSYDAADRLITVTRPGASTLGTGYDANGNVTSQTDPLGHVTSYGYDVFNRVTSMTDPLGRTTSYAYDAAGRLVSKQDPGGSCAAPVSGCTTYTHDAAGQLTGVTYSDGVTPNATFAYNTRGQVTSETDGGVFTRAYSYDTLGRVTGTTDTRGSGASASSESVGYGYDLANQLTNLDVTSYAGVHRSITRTYDNAGRMKTVADGLGHTTTFSYDRDSDLTLTAFGNNTNAVYSYDNAGQLINTIIATATGQLTFPSPRNNLSLVTQDNPTGTPAGPGLQYGYDPLQRLTSVSSSSTGATSYNYDNADRITGWATTTANRTFNYDNASQLTSQVIHPAVGATDTISYSYDTRGNRLTKTDPAMGATSSSYSYDQANRLTTLTLTGGTPNATTTQHYSYDSTGLRTDLNWDLAEGLPLVVNDETGNTYVTGPDGLPVEQISPTGTAVFYGHDQLGSTRALTASNGTIAATYTYDPYGNTTTSPGAPTNPIQYAGQYTDPTTGLIYMRARWYDPTTGSFITSDPIAARTRQPYLYASNNPLNVSDPLGLSSCGDWSLGGLVDCGSKAGGAVVDWTSSFGSWVSDHAEEISALSADVEALALTASAACGVVTLGTCEVVTGPVAAAAAIINTATSLIATIKKCSSGSTKACWSQLASLGISAATLGISRHAAKAGDIEKALAGLLNSVTSQAQLAAKRVNELHCT
jgi:RHS repeat-associated protein